MSRRQFAGSPRASLDASEIGPVIEIVTPRVKETTVADEVMVKPWGRAVVKRYRGGVIRRAMRGLFGFIGRMLRKDDVDQTYFVTAHELAHQWWGHQLVGGQVQGSNMMSEALAQ